MANAGAAPGEMSCQELVELVTDYLESSLSTSERSRFDTHLDACVGCREYLEQMRITLETSGNLDEGGVEPAALDALLDAFRGWKKQG